MTAFASFRATTARPVAATPRFAAYSTVRSAVGDFYRAFQASSRSPRPEGMDPVALRTFGRD